MRQASFGDPLFGSDQADMYQDMMDDQLAVQLSQGRGLGLADMLIRQLGQGAPESRAAAGADDDATDSVTPEQQRKFVEEILPHATAAARELGVDPRAIIAQAALETGWGTSQPADGGGASHNSSASRRARAGRARASRSRPPNSSPAAGTRRAGPVSRLRVCRGKRGRLCSRAACNRVTRTALGTGSDVRAFADALQRGGYATDPEYANKLVVDCRTGSPSGIPRCRRCERSSRTTPRRYRGSRMNNG